MSDSMADGSSLSYHSGRESPSILLPDSPGSSSVLEPPPGTAEVEEAEIVGQQSSQPFTPPNPIVDENAQVALINIHGNVDVIARRGTVNVDTDDSSATDTYETGHSSVITVAMWNRTDAPDGSSSIQSSYPSNGDDSSPGIQSMNEESNMSLPEAHVRKGQAHSDEPPAKVRKLSDSKAPNGEEMDGETCPICLDSWGNLGDHRLVALKCGHLFGSTCVERWLKAQTMRERSCPTCKSKAALKDIRYIYARRLVVADTSELTALQKQIEVLQAEKSRAELELQKSRIAHRACVQQLEAIRSHMMKQQVAKEKTVRKTWRFALEKNLEICKDGGCRVLTYNCRTYEFYVSQKSTNNLFPGYGIRKVSCVDYKLGQFVHLHPKPIRDMTYSQPRDLLLSVGLDSSARIVERGIPSATIQAGFPLWSCSWDYLRTNEFYVGGVGGVVQQYDIRNPGNFIQRLTAPGDMSPVISLCSTEYGLLSCHLNSCWLWVANGMWEPRAIPVEGPFMSLCYDTESHRALVSCRPSASGSERSRLTLCNLKATAPSGEVTCEIEQTFNGSVRTSLMSRATWVRAPGATWVAAHSESESTLFLHGLDGARTMFLPAAEPALDICSVQLNGDTVLAALSESRLRLYKAVPTSS